MKNPNEKLNAAQTSLANSLLDREKELKDLVTLCSHETAFLLGVLQGELRFLQTPDNKDVQKSLVLSQKAAERIFLLTRNLKVFSHSNFLDSELSDLSQVLLDSIDAVEKEVQDKGVRLTVLAEAGSFCKVDSEALNTAFTNLILFACQFIPRESELIISLKHTTTEILVEFKVESYSFTTQEAEHLFHPHALRDQHPSLSSLCVAPSVVKIALMNHGGGFEVIPSKTGTTYLLSLPFESKLAPTLSYPKQRRAKRIQTHLTADMSGELQSVGTVVVSVLSSLGAFIKLPKNKFKDAPQINQEISFHLNLFGGNTFLIKRAKIVNMHPDTESYGVGLEFMEVEPRGKMLLEEIVRYNIL